MTDGPIPKEQEREEPADREELFSDPDLPELPVGHIPKGAPKEPGLPPPRD